MSFINFPPSGGSGDMEKLVYDPANGSRQVAFADQLTSGYAEYDYFENLPASSSVGTVFLVRNATTSTYWLLFTKTDHFAGFYRWTGLIYEYLGNTYDNLSEMNDVALSGLTANDFLGWDSVNSHWVNKQVDTSSFELLSNKSSTIDSSTTKYPTNKAVQDALSVLTLAGLDDIDFTVTPTDKDRLLYDAGNNMWYAGKTLPTAAGNDHEIQINVLGETSASPNFRFDTDTNALEIGQPTLSLPTNPINIASTLDSYMQVNMQNKSNGENASSDFVVTADNGNDTINYGDFGINNSTYSLAGWGAFLPNDVYSYSYGNDYVLGAGVSGKKIKFIAGGTDTSNIVATMDESNGLNLASGLRYKINNVNVPISNGMDKITVGTVQPVSPNVGDLWCDTN